MANSNFNPPQSETVIERELHDKEHPYLMVSKSLIRDQDLSIRSRGVLIYLLSFPDNWKFHHKKIAKEIGIGRDQFYKSLQEIISCGYGTYEVFRNKKGHIVKHLYRFSEVKRVFVEKEPFPEIQEVDLLEEECLHNDYQPHPENPDLENTDYREECSSFSEKGSELANNEESPLADSLFSEDTKKMKELILKACCDKKIKIRSEILTRWLQKNDSLTVYANFSLMLSKKELPANPESWMEKALKGNWAEENILEKENCEWFESLFPGAIPSNIRITKKYFTDEHKQKDFYFNNPDFKNIVISTYQLKEKGVV